ncbi:hypothetical protein ACH4VR_40580 [Streptomyces sp. NPDC020883]|uniref:hypothetical protein n=1 Tax=Streptomyces sp. NPDC020883 TaxID=3365099 RepID=UPI00378E37F0
MDGDTPQAQELATWLRKLTHGLGQRDLEKKFAYGKTTWGEFLMGRKLIPSWLLEDLVNALVREPRARQRQLQRGQELLRAAEKAALEKTVLKEEEPASGSETQLRIRLDEARQGQLQAQETLLSTTQIIYTLLAVVASLRERCAVLEKERDRLAERIPATVAEVQQQLAESERRLADTETRLERARREREEAEELRIEAQLIAQKHRRALEQFQQRGRRRPAEEDSDEQAPGESPSSAVNELPELWEYDQVLAAADRQLDAHDAQITALRRHMGLTLACSDAEPDRVVVGEVVRNQAADNPDSAATSTHVDHPVSADNADTANATVAGRRTAPGHPALHPSRPGGREVHCRKQKAPVSSDPAGSDAGPRVVGRQTRQPRGGGGRHHRGWGGRRTPVQL